MIAQFTCDYRGESVLATLDDDLHWHAGHALVGHALEAICRPEDDAQVPRLFAKALEIFRGRVTVCPPSLRQETP